MVVSQGPSLHLNPIQPGTYAMPPSAKPFPIFFHCPDLLSSAMLNESSRQARWVLDGKDTISQSGEKLALDFSRPSFHHLRPIWLLFLTALPSRCQNYRRSEFTLAFPRWAALTACQYHQTRMRRIKNRRQLLSKSQFRVYRVMLRWSVLGRAAD